MLDVAPIDLVMPASSVSSEILALKMATQAGYGGGGGGTGHQGGGGRKMNYSDPGFWIIWLTLGTMALLAIHNILASLWNAYSIHRTLKRRRSGTNVDDQPQKARSSLLGRQASALFALWDHTLYLNDPPAWLSPYDVSEAVFTLCYLAINLGLCFYGSLTRATAYGNQSGRIAMSQLPLIIGLAGKNNVISAVTGISYEKLNYLHRAAGRVNLLTSWIHTGYWLDLIVKGNRHNFSAIYVRWGLVATIALTLLSLMGYKRFRRQFYEVFLYSHIILAALYLTAAYLHRVRYAYWSVPAMALWSLDRVVRLLRVLWVNAFLRTRSRGRLDADVELISADTLKVILHRPGFHWTPGQHINLTMPAVSQYPLEAHPYTIAGGPICSGEDAGKVVLIVRVRTGFTARLHQAASRGTTSTLSAYVDGPYGTMHSLAHYDAVLLLSGGSGITHGVSQLIRILREARRGKSVVRHVVLVWMVRDPDHWHWISSLLLPELRDIPPSLTIDVRIHVTRAIAEIDPGVDLTADEGVTQDPTALEGGQSAWASTSTSSESTEYSPVLSASMGGGKASGKLDTLAHACVSWKTGRADVHEILQEVLMVSPALVALEVCGPSAMKDSAKAAIKQVASSKAISRGQAPRIALYAESFDW